MHQSSKHKLDPYKDLLLFLDSMLEEHNIELETPLKWCDELYGIFNIINQWVYLDKDSIEMLAN